MIESVAVRLHDEDRVVARDKDSLHVVITTKVAVEVLGGIWG